jgi:hypothetical protein
MCYMLHGGIFSALQEMLQKVPLFQQSSYSFVRDITSLLKLESYHVGDVIFRKGEEPQVKSLPLNLFSHPSSVLCSIWAPLLSDGVFIWLHHVLRSGDVLHRGGHGADL